MTLTPNDLHALHLAKQVQERLADIPKKKPHKHHAERQPLPETSPPNPTPAPVPIERLQGFRRIACSEEMDRAELLQHPGRFHVACGLALAGMNQAALRVNLVPKQEGVLQRMTSLMRSRNPKSAWGLDLGISSLKAVKLVWNESSQQAVLEAATLIEHAKILSHAGNESEKTELVVNTLTKFLERHDTKGDRIAVSLPGRMALCRHIHVPSPDPAKVAKLIPFEAAHQFSFPLENLVWDFQILEDVATFPPKKKATDAGSCRTFLVAAKRPTTQYLWEGFQRLDLSVDLIQTDCIALHNYLFHDHLATANDSASDEHRSTVAAVDVGCDVTNIVVSSPHGPWFHSCGVAGHSFTRALVKEWKLGITQAERQKRIPPTAERLRDHYRVFSPVFDDLLQEVLQSLLAYANAHPTLPIQAVFGVGGGFSLNGLLRYLRGAR